MNWLDADESGAPSGSHPQPQAEPARSHAWYSLWWDVWTLPGRESFKTMLAEPNGGAIRSLVWMLVVGLITGLFTAVLQSSQINPAEAALPAGVRSAVKSFGVLGGFICTPLMSMIGLYIGAGIYHLVARIFHGRGSLDQLAFCLAAVQGPLLLNNSLAGLPLLLLRGSSDNTLILLVYIFLVLWILAMSVYGLVLNIMAIQTAEGIGAGSAILTYFLPILVTFALSLCLVGALSGVVRNLAAQVR